MEEIAMNPNASTLTVQQDSLKQTHVQYIQYHYRYVILALYCLLSFVVGMGWVIVAPISISVAKAYHVSYYLVSVLPLSYMVIYAFTNFPSNWLIQVKGIRTGIVVGTVGTWLGAGLRCFVGHNFMFVIVGQICCALSQAIILNAPTTIAVRWFLPQSRSLALAVLSVSSIVGSTVGVLLPSIFVNQNGSQQTIKTGFANLQLCQFFICTVASLAIIIWFKQSPPTPASPCSEAPHTRFLDQIKYLFKNKQFLSLLLAFGVINGSFNIYSSLFDSIIGCYGFSSHHISYFVAVMMLAGILSASLIGYYIEKTLNYQLIFKLMFGLALLECLAFPMALQHQTQNRFYLVMLLCAVMGIVFISSIPLLFDYSCDVLFPVSEAQITGCLNASGNIFGVVMIWICQYGLGLGKDGNSEHEQRQASFKSILMVGALTMLGVAIPLFFRGELKRTKMDNQRKKYRMVESQAF